MTFSILAHFENVHDHRAALEQIIDAWNTSFGVNLLYFAKGGPGREVDAKFLDDRSRFGRLDDCAWAKMKSSRKRDAYVLEAYFTNPARAFYGDLNYVWAALPDAWLAENENAEAKSSVVQFMMAIIEIANIKSASFEHEDICLQSPSSDVLRKIARCYNSGLGHICYLSNNTISKLGGVHFIEECGWELHGDPTQGLIASIPLDYFPTKIDAAWRLFDALEALGLFSRDGQPEIDLYSESDVMTSSAGSFLNAFEGRFGRVFGIRCDIGFEPSKA